MGQELEELRREARPEDLASLRRLEEALQQAGWKVEGKTIREWVADFALSPSLFPRDSEPVAMVSRIGLAAVPALVDTLLTPRLAARPKRDLRIRSRCLEALGLIEPEPRCVIPVLLKTLRVRSPRVQRQAIALLAKLRPPPDAVILQALQVCLASRHEPLTRLYAAHALAQLDGPLPPELRRPVLERLGDTDRRVRRFALLDLARFPAWDAELLTALEEQAILDDANRTLALRLLAGAAPARAFPLLREELRKAEGPPRDTRRLEEGLKALRILGGLGARAESLVPMLGQLQGGEALRVHVEAVVDSIVRDALYQSRPTCHAVEPGDNALATRLLQEVPPPQGTSETWAGALARWADGFLPLGHELAVRIALAAARRVAGLWDDVYPDNEYPRSGLHALEDWVCEPSAENAQRAVRLGNNVPSQFCEAGAFSASWCITYATLCAANAPPPMEWNPEDGTSRPSERGNLGTCVHAACRALSGLSVITWAFGSSEDAPAPLSLAQAAQEVRKAILDEVLPWLRGTWDPVKEPLRRRREWLAAVRPPEPEGPLDAARAAGRYPVGG
jgi:hypothetical protein